MTSNGTTGRPNLKTVFYISPARPTRCVRPVRPSQIPLSDRYAIEEELGSGGLFRRPMRLTPEELLMLRLSLGLDEDAERSRAISTLATIPSTMTGSS